MARQDKAQKSSRLQELEEVFDRRTRRFSPFEVLGLKPESSVDTPSEVSVPLETSENELDENIDETTQDLARPIPPMGVPDPPTHGRTRPTHSMGLPIPGLGRPPKVVVDLNITTSTQRRPTPGMGLSEPYEGEFDPPMGVSNSPISIPLVEETKPEILSEENLFSKEATAVTNLSHATHVADLVAAAQLGGHIGNKARQVLVYLNSIRSLEHESFTVPVGYGQISSAAAIDQDYLRRKVIPKLAMLGLLGIARRGLDGTVYHLPHSREYIQTVAGHYSSQENHKINPHEAKLSEPQVQSYDWPDWIDRQQWGWLSQEAIQRLIQKAGSDVQAREKLDIIVYNETHGSLQQRVRNRRSVLAHYLSSPQAEIWPNDQEFETLSMRQVRLERERAQKEKALAEETLRVRQNAEKARFTASLSHKQFQWITQEAKRLVDRRPDSKFLSSRYPLYKAEEERLIEEWIERTRYGESIPSTTESADS
jgi:hypothetical protein